LLLKQQEKGQYTFDPLNAMTDILEKNEKLIERFYNIFIYDESIISETLINFCDDDIEQMFASIQSGKRKSALSQVKDFLKKPFSKKTDEITVEKQVENLIDVQVQKWIENNEEDYEVMLQQEQIEILEANPLEENPLEKARNIIKNFIISKKLKL
jgi:stress response protein YsnF